MSAVRVIVACFALVGAMGCGATAGAPSAPQPTTRAPALVDADVARVLDDWHAAAAAADEVRYFAHFAAFAVFLGTDGAERWTLPEFRAYAHPHFARGKAWTMRATRREVTFRGDVAWFDEDLETAKLGPARGTGVLAKDELGAWKIVQYSLSIPIPNERFAEARAVMDGAPCPEPGRK